MKKSLKRVIELIGSEKVEDILWSYVSKNFNGNIKSVKPKVKKYKRFILGRKIWTSEELDLFRLRIAELQSQGNSFNKITKLLASEFNRTPQALWAQILKFNKQKKFQV